MGGFGGRRQLLLEARPIVGGKFRSLAGDLHQIEDENLAQEQTVEFDTS